LRAAAVLGLALLTASPFAHAAVQNADTLYSALAHAKTPEDAKQIEDQLQGLWSHSGSPSADLLLQRGQEALGDNDLETARAILKALTGVSPAFAEGWHMRAEADLQAEDYSDALLALRRTLQLEPRNFNAMAELGSILEEFNDKPHALEAYRRALALNPFVEGARDRVRELERDVEGQKI
jgi:tetratricopeptide (TPR) repeat protein